MAENRKKPPIAPTEESEGSERDRFGRFAKKLVSVPKKEIDEKAKDWEHKRRKGRSR